jgi:hypothetical protein
MKPRLLGDENTSHKLVVACRRLRAGFPIGQNWDWFNRMAYIPTDPMPQPPAR